MVLVLPTMEYEIREVPEFHIVGVELRMENTEGRAAREIPPFWEKFYSEHLKRITGRMDQDVLGLYLDYESDHNGPYSLIAGCRVPADYEAPAGMTKRTIAAARYAVFPTSGDFPAALQSVWSYVWDSDLRRTYKTDFELYGERFGAKGEVEVCVAII